MEQVLSCAPQYSTVVSTRLAAVVTVCLLLLLSLHVLLLLSLHFLLVLSVHLIIPFIAVSSTYCNVLLLYCCHAVSYRCCL